MEEIVINYEHMPWQEAKGYPKGTEIKVLREGQEGAARTVLLRFKKGFEMKPHSHVTNEQHVVLEGEYESGGEVYGAGTYQFIPRHVNHGPFKSSTGAVVLVIWDPV